MDFTIDLSSVQNKSELHDLLSATFNFPDYYGRNLDALYDLITEPHEFWNVTFENTASAEVFFDETFLEALKQTFADAEIESENLKVTWNY